MRRIVVGMTGATGAVLFGIPPLWGLVLMTMAAKAIAIEIRPAIRRRARRSRPSWSVPRRCPPVSGPAKRLRMSI